MMDFFLVTKVNILTIICIELEPSPKTNLISLNGLLLNVDDICLIGLVMMGYWSEIRVNLKSLMVERIMHQVTQTDRCQLSAYSMETHRLDKVQL